MVAPSRWSLSARLLAVLGLLGHAGCEGVVGDLPEVSEPFASGKPAAPGAQAPSSQVGQPATPSPEGPAGAGSDPAGQVPPDVTSPPGPVTPPQTPPPAQTGSGLPCDVETLVKTRCQTCHGSTTKSGGITLLSYEDLVAPSPVLPAERVLDRAVIRVMDKVVPMPPNGNLPATETSPLMAWKAAGAPRIDCTTPSTPPPPATGPTPTVCSSNRYWTSGNDGSSSMHPGVACINCHRNGDGPRFTAAGTVYPSLHEPNDCNGNMGGVMVELTDSNGKVVMLNANSVGNFNTNQSMIFPVRVKLIANGATRQMVSPAPNGDCNSCHTVLGSNGAPGRVLSP